MFSDVEIKGGLGKTMVDFKINHDIKELKRQMGDDKLIPELH